MLDENGDEIELSDVFEDDVPTYASLDDVATAQDALAESDADDDDAESAESEDDEFDEEYSYEDESDDDDSFDSDEE